MQSQRLAYAGLLLALVVYVALTAVYFRIVPPLEGNDSLAHMNYVNYLREHEQWPQIDSETAAYSYELVQQPPLYYMLGALVSRPLSFDAADEQTRRSENAYFGKLSPRWSISLPDATPSFYRSVRLARLVSVVGGLLAVAATWFWIRTALPQEPHVATATASLVAFNPHFLFLATTVTNDTWSVAGMVTPIWLTTAAARRPTTRAWSWFAIGLVIGLAVLTKYSVVLVGLPVLTILLAQPRLRAWRPLGRILVLLAAGAMLTGGAWYLRNLWLYGELMPMRALAEAVPTILRETPATIGEILGELPWLLQSYWGAFVAVLAPPDFYLFWRIFMLVGTAGLGLYLVRNRGAIHWSLLLTCAVWMGAVLFSAAHWMRLVAFGMQARLIHIAGPAIALLLVLGWQWLFPRRWQNGFLVLLLPILALVAIWPLPTLQDRFALPAPLAPDIVPDRPIDAAFAGGPHLIGLDLPVGAALEAGGALPLVLYFATNELIDEDYTLFIHLSDADDNLLYQWDGVPFDGRHPTRQWRTFEGFADSHQLTVEEDAAEGLLTLSVGFYHRGEPERRLPVVDGNGVALGDRVALASIRIVEEAPGAATDQSPLAAWAEGIALLDAAFIQEDGRITLDTTWRTDRQLHTDYTIFVQLLDGAGQLVAQADERPQQGQAPTSTWLPDETIADRLAIDHPWREDYTLIIGLYNAATGERLPLRQPENGAAQDYYVIQAGAAD